MLNQREVQAGYDPTVLDRESGFLSRVGPPVCQDCIVALVLAEHQVATLENGSSVAKDEVYGAVDVTFFVELTEGECIESVLVPNNAASVEN